MANQRDCPSGRNYTSARVTMALVHLGQRASAKPREPDWEPSGPGSGRCCRTTLPPTLPRDAHLITEPTHNTNRRDIFHTRFVISSVAASAAPAGAAAGCRTLCKIITATAIMRASPTRAIASPTLGPHRRSQSLKNIASGRRCTVLPRNLGCCTSPFKV